MPEPNNSTTTNQSSDRKPNHTIVMVDSDTEALKRFDAFFKSKGCRFIPVRDPRTFLKIIKTDKPDIILMEVTWGKTRCEPLIKAFRDRGIKTPIIIVSANIDRDLILNLKDMNVSEFFTKPVDLEKLRAKISAVIKTAKLRKKLPAELTYSGRKLWPPLTALIITENINIKNDPGTIIPGIIVEKFKLRVFSRGTFQKAVEILKKPDSNIKIILVDAAKEAKIKAMTRLLKIIETKLNIPIFFFSEQFSQALNNIMIKTGFVNLFSRSGNKQKLIAKMESVLGGSNGDESKKAAHHVQNIMKELKNIKTLPPMPEIYLKIEKLSHNKNATSKDYANILELDTSITARLLRMSNSAYYSFNRKIKSVKDTVTLMGTREILSLVRLACITGNLKTKPDVEVAVRKVWEHSAACAITAKLLYEKTDLCTMEDIEEELFICGIIHDIGKVVLWNSFTDIYMPFILHSKVSSYPTVSEEQKYLGASHSEVGRALAEYWKLPEPLTNAIAFHHKPMARADSELVRTIHVADVIADIVMERVNEGKDPESDPELLEKFNFTADSLHDLATSLAPKIKENVAVITKMITG